MPYTVSLIVNYCNYLRRMNYYKIVPATYIGIIPNVIMYLRSI